MHGGSVSKPGARRAPPLLGERAITRFRCRYLIVAAAPLLLGGCGLPIGVQLVSLFADGVSFLATDKTLTDHGISLVAEKDCAIWRGFKGEDICREVAPDDILIADASEEPEISAFPDGADAIVVADIAAFPDSADTDGFTAPDEPQVLIAGAEADLVEPLAAEVAEAATVSEPETKAIVRIAELPPAKPVFAPTQPEVAERTVVLAELPPSKPVVAELAAFETAAGPENAGPALKTGGTFLIIASYFSSEDAERYARSQEELDIKVLSGTAKGHAVYRVAVGPFTPAERARAKDDLVQSGFRDVWALRLREPKVVVQMAAID